MLKASFRFLFVSVWSPIHTKIVHLIAYGPWGKFIHQLFIQIFKGLYNIEWPDTSSFETLGAFFLRDVPKTIAGSILVSPAESTLIDGPTYFRDRPVDPGIEVKGLHYEWSDFKEINFEKFKANGCFWNFYLAPKNYHWVHAAAEGTKLFAQRRSGKLYPVNALGRNLGPNLYTENERLTFRWQSESLGEVVMICIGAMAVSQLFSVKGHVPYNDWIQLSERVEKAERLLAFKLGSSVILLVERAPSGLIQKNGVHLGDALC